jgi:leucyl aminopeptidase
MKSETPISPPSSSCQSLDMPPNILHTDHYADIVQHVVEDLNSKGHHVAIRLTRGEELATLGLNGLYGVGKVLISCDKLHFYP